MKSRCYRFWMIALGAVLLGIGEIEAQGAPKVVSVSSFDSLVLKGKMTLNLFDSTINQVVISGTTAEKNAVNVDQDGDVLKIISTASNQVLLHIYHSNLDRIRVLDTSSIVMHDLTRKRDRDITVSKAIQPQPGSKDEEQPTIHLSY